MLFLLLACEGAEVDTYADSFCQDVPRLEWENFGDGFMTQNCQPCHASTSAARYGAPEDTIFDTEEETLALADRVLARATGDDADMPPAGGVEDDDMLKLEIWLTCWE
jgi:uncharacterized membrane protein